jgi:hypothetical protein
MNAHIQMLYSGIYVHICVYIYIYVYMYIYIVHVHDARISCCKYHKIYTHGHKSIHIDTHAQHRHNRNNTYIHTYIHTYTHVCLLRKWRAISGCGVPSRRLQSGMRIPLHVQTYVYLQFRPHNTSRSLCLCACMCNVLMCVRMCTHTHTHTHTHIYIHTHTFVYLIYIYIYIYNSFFLAHFYCRHPCVCMRENK